MAISDAISLIIRQQPEIAVVTLPNKEKGRKSIDPPPVVEMRMNRQIDPNQQYLCSPYLFMIATLAPATADSDEDEASLRDQLIGQTSSSLHRLRDLDNQESGFFVFGDLSCRKLGEYRLKFSLFEMHKFDGGVYMQGSVFSEPFKVIQAKNHTGMSNSTPLSRNLADQGVKLRLKKEHRTASIQTFQTSLNRQSSSLTASRLGSAGSAHLQPSNPHTPYSQHSQQQQHQQSSFSSIPRTFAQPLTSTHASQSPHYGQQFQAGNYSYGNNPMYGGVQSYGMPQYTQQAYGSQQPFGTSALPQTQEVHTDTPAQAQTHPYSSYSSYPASALSSTGQVHSSPSFGAHQSSSADHAAGNMQPPGMYHFRGGSQTHERIPQHGYSQPPKVEQSPASGPSSAVSVPYGRDSPKDGVQSYQSPPSRNVMYPRGPNRAYTVGAEQNAGQTHGASAVYDSSNLYGYQSHSSHDLPMSQAIKRSRTDTSDPEGSHYDLSHTYSAPPPQIEQTPPGGLYSARTTAEVGDSSTYSAPTDASYPAMMATPSSSTVDSATARTATSSSMMDSLLPEQSLPVHASPFEESHWPPVFQGSNMP
ncbi:hypothetical protein K431DRAFT_92572 [Polychaeton citri CBS 116435]|uniref:Velvet domain-containing protein n=1 Tax=Polychaeton citri CBS 116435 TaxID=1314669 RepID=A0A9P4Q4B2_9PEZI|nr:hypothetical protein K431DRAFT_92572 [Polychaeton citri CBS 116435]